MVAGFRFPRGVIWGGRRPRGFGGGRAVAVRWYLRYGLPAVTSRSGTPGWPPGLTDVLSHARRRRSRASHAQRSLRRTAVGWFSSHFTLVLTGVAAVGRLRAGGWLDAVALGDALRAYSRSRYTSAP